MTGLPPPEVSLRDVAAEDLPVFFEHQRDPEADRMAAFPARDRDSFDAHWGRILRDETVTAKTILSDRQVAGNVVSFERSGRTLIGYWIGREYWGKGVATLAVSRFVATVGTRPLHAHVATTNRASIRVLEKCGFALSAGPSTPGDDGVEELVFELLRR